VTRTTIWTARSRKIDDGVIWRSGSRPLARRAVGVRQEMAAPAAGATPYFARRFPRATWAFTLIQPCGRGSRQAKIRATSTTISEAQSHITAVVSARGVARAVRRAQPQPAELWQTFDV